MKDLITGKQIQELLGVSRQYFWQLKQRREFPEPIFKEGRVELWNKEDVERYIKNKK
jgi:predicted DNA-binding transcriptional regulator AlpA